MPLPVVYGGHVRCPYSGKICRRCTEKCALDNLRKRDPQSGRIVIDLSTTTFKCACGAVIKTPVHSCKTEGCKFNV